MHHQREPYQLDVMAPTSAPARQVLRAYTEDICSRYYGRPVTDAEVDEALRELPSDDLVLPHGLLLVAHQDAAVLGCAGLRLLPGRIGEVTRVFVAHAARGRGIGGRLMIELERHGHEHDVATLRLDTRGDLVEARRLYTRLGYREVPAFNEDPYVDHWFAKSLG